MGMGVVSRNGWKTKSLVISTGVARAIHGFWLIVISFVRKPIRLISKFEIRNSKSEGGG
jgi:hypothetical protein